MSIGFLNNFMQFAYTVTDSERGIALDIDKTIHERLNVTDALLSEEAFSELLYSSINDAITTNDIVIANNLMNPDEAPETNVHIHKLRMVVALPLQGYGAIYLDKRLREGVFSRDLVERLIVFFRYIVENDKTDLTASEFIALFEESPTA